MMSMQSSSAGSVSSNTSAGSAHLTSSGMTASTLEGLEDIKSNKSAPSASKRGVEGVRVAIVTMGCAKNEVDSEKMRLSLSASGAQIVDDASRCDVIIVNTCSFIQSATEESLDAIFDSLSLSESSDSKIPVIVSGCMPARYGDELEGELPEVSAFVPCSKEDDIVEVVRCAVVGNARSADTQALVSSDQFELEFAPDPVEDMKSYAYVKISDGCDRWCSYCTIPIIRGRYHSFSLGDIEREVSRCVLSGKKEIVLIAQDTGRWGQDFSEPSSLGALMAYLAEKYPDIWFRVMYVQPEGITDELLDVMASHDNICSYLDIPLQHISKHILRAMNRRGSREDFLSLIERVRTKVPDITLRTTFIAGFPGESDEDFEALKDFIEEGYFTYVGVFPYSREDSTKSATLDGQLDEEEKVYRAATLTSVADAVSSAKISERIGDVCSILVEGEEEDGQLFGRCMSQAPEVDGITFVDSGVVGSFVKGEISDTLFYDMEAQSIQE